MVMPVPPYTFVCRRCGWKRTSLMSSDAIFGSPEKCPQCGSDDFEWRLATATEIAKKKLRVALRMEPPF